MRIVVYNRVGIYTSKYIKMLKITYKQATKVIQPEWEKALICKLLKMSVKIVSVISRSVIMFRDKILRFIQRSKWE